MKNQYEQHLNAASLENLGVPVIKSLKKKYEYAIELWLNDQNNIHVDYPNNTMSIVESIVKNHI